MNLSRMHLFLLLFLVFLFPLQAEGFSQKFMEEMTSVQEKVMLRGIKFTEAEAGKCWEKFDEEILALLSPSKRVTEKDLNRETAAIELTFVDRKGEEKEWIELGTVEAKFLRLDREGEIWLAALHNRMGDLFSSTFHIYRKENGSYGKVAAFEEASGPWDRAKILQTAIQIQPIVSIPPSPERPFTAFTSYHLPSFKKSQNNRSQIVWEFDGTLRPIFWIPEVDWHLENDVKVTGRGAVISITP